MSMLLEIWLRSFTKANMKDLSLLIRGWVNWGGHKADIKISAKGREWGWGKRHIDLPRVWWTLWPPAALVYAEWRYTAHPPLTFCLKTLVDLFLMSRNTREYAIHVSILGIQVCINWKVHISHACFHWLVSKRGVRYKTANPDGLCPCWNAFSSLLQKR